MRQIYFYLVIIGINWFNISYSQKAEKLLIVNFQNKEYFAPDIINCLNNLKINKEDKIVKAFDNVIVLNQLQNHVTEQAGIKSLTDYFKQDSKYKDLSKEAKEIYDTISKNLGDYNSFLDINVNQINELIEIQFSLYSNILNKGNSTIATKDPRPDKYQSAIFVPLENNYLNIIEKNIKKLFPETNLPPQSIIFVNGKRDINRKELFFAIGDTITIDGSFSSDQDSRKEDLNYYWREIDILSQFATLPVDYTKSNISFSLDKQGKYIFGLTVFDGISFSVEDTVNITIFNKPRIYISNRDINFVYQNSGSYPRKKDIFKYVLDVASSNYHPKAQDLVIKDLNEDIYLDKTDSLQMIEKYLGFDSIPPAGLLLHRNYNYYGRHFTVDSIKTTYGGYKLFFSGNPTTSNYSFQIYEQYKGLKSNSYQVNFMTDYLSKTKVGFEYQLINLSSHKYYNWEDISNPSNSSNQSDTSRFEYNYKYFYTYISYYLNRRLVLDWNLNQLYYKIANRFPAEYIPIMRLSYEFGPPDYLKLSPLITLGSSGLNKDSGTVILGYGGSFTWCYKKVVFISIGAEYLDGITYDFKGVSYHYSIRFDMIKLIKELVSKSDK